MLKNIKNGLKKVFSIKEETPPSSSEVVFYRCTYCKTIMFFPDYEKRVCPICRSGYILKNSYRKY